jgi:hydrogenase maturation protein HypF
MAASPAALDAAMIVRERLRVVVVGTVQGVGFRPFVHRHATALGLAGWVGNSTEGVTIEIEGEPDRLDALVERIRRAPPANASVAGIEIQQMASIGDAGFTIRESEAAGARTADVVPDLATCGDCLAELYDPSNRRYRYPFINCTQCGPRYSIIRDIPYDRAQTSMRGFAMCAACRAEYDNPVDRRFHAEPNACPHCGPRLGLWDANGVVLAHDDGALQGATSALRRGRIMAVKGIGGFHLYVDARNEDAVRRLRAAKRREEKPFAVMFPTIDQVRECCQLRTEEEALLAGPQRPIVLLRRKGGSMAPSVAPGNPRLGALLPYAPLHHLLLGDLGFPVVATSGNLVDEPIVTDEAEVLARLEGIADLFLVHDRPIVCPLDDSVAQLMRGQPQLLRRARGYAPSPISVAGVPNGILAFGGHQKATVALTCGQGIALSEHIGDLDTVMAREAHARAATEIVRMRESRPRIAVCDLHPDYASTRAAESSKLPVMAVQHHVAHVAACMAENGLDPPALGIAWDGTGYGPDGAIWGGEFLMVDERGWRRVAHLRRFPLPGGAAAIREPRRAALGLLYATYGEDAFEATDLPPITSFTPTERTVLQGMLRRRVNSPTTTSAGRLFDAFAALCGLNQRAGYEGQAATALEWSAYGRSGGRAYDMPVREAEGDSLVVDWEPALSAALSDLRTGAPAGAVSEALHNGLAAAIATVAQRIGARRVVLTGGCFQNIRLTEAAVAALESVGCEPFWHRLVPPNDGGIAFGQAAWAAWCERREEETCASRFQAES